MPSTIYNTENAKEYGINIALFLEKLIYFTASNRVNNRNVIDGKCWVHFEGGYAAITSDSHIPELSKFQLHYAINKMVNQGLIEVGNFNKFKWDRSYWYCLNEKIFNSQILEKITHIKGAKKSTATAVVKTPSNAPAAPPVMETKIETKPTSRPSFDTDEVQRKFKKLSGKYDSSPEEMEEIGMTAFNAHFLQAFTVVYSNWSSEKIMAALKDIIIKTDDNFFLRNGKRASKTELMIELDWLFYTFRTTSKFKNDPDKFNPSYIRGGLSSLLAQSIKLKKQHYSKANSFERQKRDGTIFKEFNELYLKLKRNDTKTGSQKGKK
jgi:hypothetical protein